MFLIFPTQDSINTESLSMVPHTTDGSVFANSMVIVLVKRRNKQLLCYLVWSFSHQINKFLILALTAQNYLIKCANFVFKCFLPALL